MYKKQSTLIFTPVIIIVDWLKHLIDIMYRGRNQQQINIRISVKMFSSLLLYNLCKYLIVLSLYIYVCIYSDICKCNLFYKRI